jgi:hypothetical protein
MKPFCRYHFGFFHEISMNFDLFFKNLYFCDDHFNLLTSSKVIKFKCFQRGITKKHVKNRSATDFLKFESLPTAVPMEAGERHSLDFFNVLQFKQVSDQILKVSTRLRTN